MESPGEAFLFLAGLAVFSVSLVGFFVLGILAEVSDRGLIPVMTVAQVGILFETVVENRIVKRRYPPRSWWRRVFSFDDARVRRRLWTWSSLAQAVRLVRPDVVVAARSGLTGLLLEPRWIGLSIALIGGTAAFWWFSPSTPSG